jgi:hypothetical protein
MAFGRWQAKIKKGFSCALCGGKTELGEKRLRILIPAEEILRVRVFRGLGYQLEARDEEEAKEDEENEMEKGKIIILLCYSEHVKISFHYALNAPCAYYAFLIPGEEAERARQQQQLRNPNVDRSFLQRRETLFISLGKWKCQSEGMRYAALLVAAFGYDFASAFAFRLRRLLLSSSARRIPKKKALQEVKGLKALAER